MNSSEKGKFLGSRLPAIILIVLTGIIIYSNSLRGPFLFDDSRTIVENEKIREVSNFLGFDRILYERPLVDLTFALNYRFGQLDPFGYHFVNLVVHILNGVIVYFLAGAILLQLFKFNSVHPSISHPQPQKKKRLIVNSETQETDRNRLIPLIALFTALIFVAHPIQTQAVSYICQRYASMAALFYLLSVLLYLKGRITQRDWHAGEGARNDRCQTDGSEPRSIGKIHFLVFFFLCILSGILAFLSKQSAASLPITILLVEYFCIDSTWAGWRRKVPWIGLFLVLGFVTVLYGMGGFQNAGSFSELLEDVSAATRDSETVSRWKYLNTQFPVLAKYIQLLFFPVGQNADPAFPFKTGFFDGWTPIAFLFLASLISVAIWWRKKIPVISFGILWFFIALSVESSIIPIRDAMFEHRLYLPVFGFSIAFSSALFYFFAEKKMLATIFSFGIIVSLGIAAYHRNAVWQNEHLLWADVVSKSPRNSRAHTNVGIALARQGKTREAIEHFNESLRIKGGDPKTLMNLGNAMAMMRQYDEAIVIFSKLLDHDPKNAKAHFNMGTALAHQERIAEAENHFRKAITISPGFADAKINLGIALMRQGKLEEAVACLHEVLAIHPNQKDAHAYLGLVLAKQGKFKDAEQELAVAVQMDPFDLRSRTNLASVLAMQGRVDDAIRQLREVLRLKPDSELVLKNLAILMKKKADTQAGKLMHQEKRN